MVQISVTPIEQTISTTAIELSAIWRTWPNWLIAVVFAGMLLVPHGNSSQKQKIKTVTSQGIMVWIIVLGETAVGLLAVWLLIQPVSDVPNSLGMLIETGFAGGHGTAGAMGAVFENPAVNLEGGRDLGMLMATFGLVYGVVSGILWINLGYRMRWVGSTSDGIEKRDDAKEMLGTARVQSDTLDPLLFQMAWLALAFGIGYLMQNAVGACAAQLDQWIASEQEVDEAGKQLAKRLTVSNITSFPLFIYTLFGGLLVRKLTEANSISHLIDPKTVQRLTSTAMDVLVVAAIASLNLGVALKMATPLFVLFVCGAIWTAICLILISRLVLPKDYWFQLGLINYGMSTGTTATGFVLLKMVDPNLKTEAASDYALAAPLSAPFIGGGIITIALPLLLLERVSIAIPAVSISAIICVLVLVGWKLNNRQQNAV